MISIHEKRFSELAPFACARIKQTDQNRYFIQFKKDDLQNAKKAWEKEVSGPAIGKGVAQTCGFGSLLSIGGVIGLAIIAFGILAIVYSTIYGGAASDYVISSFVLTICFPLGGGILVAAYSVLGHKVTEPYREYQDVKLALTNLNAYLENVSD